MIFLICQRETETPQTQILKDLVHNRYLIDGVSLYPKDMCGGQKYVLYAQMEMSRDRLGAPSVIKLTFLSRLLKLKIFLFHK